MKEEGRTCPEKALSWACTLVEPGGLTIELQGNAGTLLKWELTGDQARAIGADLQRLGLMANDALGA